MCLLNVFVVRPPSEPAKTARNISPSGVEHGKFAGVHALRLDDRRGQG